uniref:Acyl-coenzyme A thioesterase 13 n=1 Tax=Panagrellus redivivus TaxID=6233 RepID=A0A7E4ZZJ7_PANRE
MAQSTTPVANDYFEYLVDVVEKLSTVKDFSRVVKKIVPVSATESSLKCELTIEEEHSNRKGTLHGGQTATLIDFLTSRTIGLTDRNVRTASVEISVSYMNAVKTGDVIEITATCIKKGRSLAFTECELRRKEDGKIIAKGKQTIAILNK